MQIHLNSKYGLYWNANKTRKLLLAFFIMLNLLYFTYIMVIIHFQMYDVPFKILGSFHKYISPVYYVSFLITASAVYFYVFKLIYKNQ